MILARGVETDIELILWGGERCTTKVFLFGTLHFKESCDNTVTASLYFVADNSYRKVAQKFHSATASNPFI